MIPVIALVGRPNVGKSTLFNRLTRSHKAIVDDQPGVTRDRQYGQGKMGDKPYLVVDTGGMFNDDEALQPLIEEQVDQILKEANVIVFMVDGREGLTHADKEVATRLRVSEAPIYLVINKAEGQKKQLVSAEFYELAAGDPFVISSRRGDGIQAMVSEILEPFPAEQETEQDDEIIKVAVVGRPNVGKSTLINRLAGDHRVIVMDQPGTTRDSIEVNISRDEQQYVFIDTAGVRKRSRVDEDLEKLSVVKTLQALHESNVVVLMVDASQEVSEQDSHLAGLVDQSGRALVVAVNKWDGQSNDQRADIRYQLERKFKFLPKHQTLFISALHGTGMGELIKAINKAFESALTVMTTGKLNRIIKDAVLEQSPPWKGQFPPKLKFAHQGGKNPPRVIIHGNSLDSIPDSYCRYLGSVIAQHYNLIGTRVEIELRQSENPFYKDKRKK